MTSEQTSYRYTARCRACNGAYTSTVGYAEVNSSDGDYVKRAYYSVPSYCPDCREQPGNSTLLYKRIDLSEASLSWVGRIKLLAGLCDYPKDPTPSQSEQVEMLLGILGEFEDPIDGEFDEILFLDRYAVPFYHAWRRLDDEHFDVLSRRAWREYNVRVEDLVERGEEYMRENDLIEKTERDTG